MADTPAQSPEERLAAYFSPPAPAKSAPATDTQQAPESDVSPEEPPPAAEDAAPEEQPDETPPEEPSEPLVELTHNNQKWKIPQSAAKAFEETRAMATQVAQRTAELKRQLDTRAQAMQLQHQFEQQIVPDKEVVQSLDLQLKNIRTALASDEYTMEQKFNLSLHESRLKEEKATKLSELQNKFQQFSQEQSKLRDEAIAKGVEYLKYAIPQFSERHAAEISNYAVANGYAKQEIDEALDPRVLRDLWKAAQWDALQASKGAMMQKANTAPTAKPTGTSSRDSNAVRQYQDARQKLKKTGTIHDAAAVILQRMK